MGKTSHLIMAYAVTIFYCVCVCRVALEMNNPWVMLALVCMPTPKFELEGKNNE